MIVRPRKNGCNEFPQKIAAVGAPSPPAPSGYDATLSLSPRNPPARRTADAWRGLSIWRLSTGGIAFHILEAGAYQIPPNSLSFPQLASADLPPFLAQWGQSDDTAIVRQQMMDRPMMPSGQIPPPFGIAPPL